MTSAGADGSTGGKEHATEIGAIVVNYNAGPRLRTCIEALLQEARFTSIWIVDNHSDDASLEAAETATVGDLRVNVLRNMTNIGFGAANNLVLRGRPDIDWLLINPDCVLKPGAIRAFLACRQAHERGGLFGGLVRNPDGSEQRGCRRDLPRLGASLARTLGVPRLVGRRRWSDFDHTGEALSSEPVRVEAVSGALMYFRAEALQQTGIFDEGYFLHCEDLDICKRMADKGWEVWFVPDAEAIHYQGTSSRRAPLRVNWHKHRSMWRYYCKFEAPAHSSLLNVLVFAGIWLRFATTSVMMQLRRATRA